MADSHVAALIQYIQTLVLDPGLGGITPPPLPNDATFPYVTVHKIMEDDPAKTLSGPSGLKRTIMQINVWSPDHEEANAALEAIRDASIGLVGPVGSLVADGSYHVADAELFNPERAVHQLISRIMVWWTQDVAGDVVVARLVNAIKEYDLSDQLPSSDVVLPVLPSGTFFQLFRGGLLQSVPDDYTRDGLAIHLPIPGIAGERLIAAYVDLNG